SSANVRPDLEKLVETALVPAGDLSATDSSSRPMRCWGAGACLDVPKRDAAFAQVVWRDFQGDLVTGDHTNVMLAYLCCAVSDQIVSVVECDAIARIGHDLGHDAIHFEKFFLGHKDPAQMKKKKPGELPGSPRPVRLTWSTDRPNVRCLRPFGASGDIEANALTFL